MVWWVCDWDGIILLRVDGPQLGNCCMGRYPTCVTKLRALRNRSISQGLHSQCWLHVDAVQLPMQRCLRPGHEKANQIDELQRLRQ